MNRQLASIRQTTANFDELLELIAEEYKDDLADSPALVDAMLSNKGTESVGEVSNDVDSISSPKCSYTLLTGNTCETVTNSSISWYFTTSNSRVSILGLNNKFYSFNWSCYGF